MKVNKNIYSTLPESTDSDPYLVERIPRKNNGASKKRDVPQAPEEEKENSNGCRKRKSTAPNNFEISDKKVKTFQSEQEINKMIMSIVPSVNEERECLLEVCQYYDYPVTVMDNGSIVSKKDNLPVSNWYFLVEAQNLFYDKQRQKMGLKPIFSEMLSEPVILVGRKPIELPFKIGLFVIYREDNSAKDKKRQELVNVISTDKDYWSVIGTIHQHGRRSGFSSPLEGKEEEASLLFRKLIDSTNKNSDFDNIDKFIAMHPEWAFVRLPKSYKEGDVVSIPFIKNSQDKTVNDINFNLIETNALTQEKVQLMNDYFDDGFIPNLILHFISGKLHSSINTIIFHRSIYRDSGKGRDNRIIYYRGYRTRILADTTSKDKLNDCKSFLEKNFINEISKSLRNNRTASYHDCVKKWVVSKYV